MEVRLEALEGQSVPQDVYISLRVGAVQKQSRFGPNRSFHFPDPKDGSKADFGRIEVYKKIGHCNVPLAGLDQIPRDVRIPCGDAALPNLGFRIEIESECMVGAQDKSKDKVKRKRDKLDEAQKYIADHNLEQLLAASLRDVMRKQPGDPASFLSDQIMEKKMKPQLPPLSGKAAKAKHMNRSASEPHKVALPQQDQKIKGQKPFPEEAASPTRSRPAAPPKVAPASPGDEPPAAIPQKALSRSASWCGSGVGVQHLEESPKAACASDDTQQPRHAAPATAEAVEGTTPKAESPPCQQLQNPVPIPGHLVPTAQAESLAHIPASTSPLAMVHSFPLPEPPSKLPDTITSGRQMDASYIQELKGAIDAKEAKLRALAAQLQELSRLQHGAQ